MSDGKKENN